MTTNSFFIKHNTDNSLQLQTNTISIRISVGPNG